MNVLLVSISAPPKSGAESIQTAKVIKGLYEAGHSITLITTIPSDQGWKSKDIGQVNYLRYVDDLILLNDFERLITLIQRLVPSGFLEIPDRHFVFTRSVSRLLRRIKNPPSIIYARGLPMSSLILGSKISKELGVPLISHLGDPYLLNPYYSFHSQSRARKFEKFAFSYSSKICLTTPAMKLLYMQEYPEFANRFEVFPNIYDPEECHETSQHSDKLILVFTGNIYGDRNLDPILTAVRNMTKRDPLIKDELKILIYGNLNKDEGEKLSSYQLTNLDIKGPVTYEESLKKQSTAHVLISVDKPAQLERDLIFLPSKLLDYLCAGKLVLNISSGGSSSSLFIKESMIGQSYEHDNIKGIENFLLNCLNEFRSGNLKFFNKMKRNEKYEVKFNINKLTQWFHQLD